MTSSGEKLRAGGRQVKTFKHQIPYRPEGGGLAFKEIVGKVYFDAKSGRFAIYFPDEVAAVTGGLPKLHNDAIHRDVSVSGKVMDEVIDAYRHTLNQYQTLLETTERKKVILVDTKANIRYIADFHGKRTDYDRFKKSDMQAGISFCKAPAVHLSYEVLYQVGAMLYNVRNPGNREETEYMDYRCPAKAVDGQLVDWTQEREDFFARIVSNIERLIMAITEFMDDMEGNLTKAIAAGGNLQLPPPIEKESE